MMDILMAIGMALQLIVSAVAPAQDPPPPQQQHQPADHGGK